MKKLYPNWSHQAIAKKIKCSHHFVSRWAVRYEQDKTVNDKPRSGRPHKADATALVHIKHAAKQPGCSTAAAILAKTQQQVELNISLSTAKRLLRGQGLKHLSPRVVPIMTALHKAARLKLAKQIIRREGASMQRVMITDSKYFHLHNMSTPAAKWCTPATRGTVARPKHSIAAHVYMGMSYWGTTQLRFVTGTHKQASKYINPKTKRLYPGVGGEEYNDVLCQHFLPEGKRLFQNAGRWAGNWQLQQDNAPPHKTATNMAYIAANVPGGPFLEWPANSPDLSPIETLWAWMDSKLHKQYKPKNIEELKQSLEEIRLSIPLSMLRSLMTGMQRRMKRVIALNGEHIGM